MKIMPVQNNKQQNFKGVFYHGNTNLIKGHIGEIFGEAALKAADNLANVHGKAGQPFSAVLGVNPATKKVYCDVVITASEDSIPGFPRQADTEQGARTLFESVNGLMTDLVLNFSQGSSNKTGKANHLARNANVPEWHGVSEMPETEFKTFIA